jgi:hypothetical protein
MTDTQVKLILNYDRKKFYDIGPRCNATLLGPFVSYEDNKVLFLRSLFPSGFYPQTIDSAEKSLVASTPVANVIKLFTAVNYDFS